MRACGDATLSASYLSSLQALNRSGGWRGRLRGFRCRALPSAFILRGANDSEWQRWKDKTAMRRFFSFVIGWSWLVVCMGGCFNMAAITGEVATSSKVRVEEARVLHPPTRICIFLPREVAKLKIPKLQLTDCPLFDFLKTINEFTSDIRGSSRLNVHDSCKDGKRVLKIVFEDSRGCILCPFCEGSGALSKFPQLGKSVTMDAVAFSSLEEILDKLVMSLNNEAASTSFEIVYYESL